MERYWAFVANPKTYKIQNSLLDKEANWTVKKHDVRKGDHVLIWKAKAYEPNRGIVALADVLSEPAELADPDDKHWVNPEDAKQVERRVRVRYNVTPTMPLWEANNSFLSTLTVARSTGGTVFKITPLQWRKVLELLGIDD